MSFTPLSNSNQNNPHLGFNTDQTVTTQARQATSEVVKTPAAPLDTSEASSSVAQQKDYQKLASQPALPAPLSTNYSGDAVADHLFNPQKILEFLKSADTAPSPAAQQHKEELQKVKVNDPEIVALAEKFGMSPGEAQEKLRFMASYSFKEFIKDLPDDQQKKLTFARMNPEGASNLSPELKTLFKQISDKVNQTMIAELADHGVSPTWGGVTPNTTEFSDATTVEFDTAFEKLLSQQETDGKVTSQQALKLRAMHYMPGMHAKDSKLQSLFSDLEGTAANSLRDRYGAAASWTPKADTEYLKQVAEGFFRQIFQELLNAYQPPLTSAQKDAVINLFSNPGSMASDSAKSILKAITEKSAAATALKFGLDETWMPSIDPIINSNIDAGKMKLATDALATATAMYKSFEKILSGMPEGPSKLAYVNYLKAIGESLHKLQEFLYALSSVHASNSKKLSKANMDTSLADIDRAQKQSDEAKAQESKTKKLNLGPLGAIGAWFTKIITLAVSYALCAVLGPVGVLLAAVATAYFIDSIQAEIRGKPSIFQMMAKEIDDAVGNGSWALTGLITLLMGGANPLMTITMMSDAKVIQGLVKTCGGDEMAQQITAAVFNGVAQMAAMVVLMMLSGGTAAPAFMAQITAAAAKAMDMTVKTLETIINVITVLFTIATGALQVTQKALECQWELVKGDIARILAHSEAASEQVKVLISTLRKLINKLLAVMNGLGDELITVSRKRGNIYDQASLISSELAG